MAKGRILVVEDEENLLHLESLLLTNKGYQVTGVMNGLSALEALSAQRHDLVLLDVMLPQMDGFEVCRRIKDNPETCSIPVVMLTARKRSEDLTRGDEAGADAYITKPFKSAQVMEAIEVLLKSKGNGA